MEAQIRPPGVLCRALAVLLLIVVSTVFVAMRIADGTSFSSNILALIPEARRDGLSAAAANQAQSMSERKFAVLISSAERPLSQKVHRQLANDMSDAGLANFSDNSQILLGLTDYYKTFRYQLLSAAQRDYLRSTDAETIADQALAELFGPVPAYRPYAVVDDPFNIGAAFFASLLGQTSADLSRSPSLSATEGIWLQDGEQEWLLLNGELKGDPYDLGIQQQVDYYLAELDAMPVDVLVSGLVFHAAEGARTGRKEVRTLGLLSLTAIVLLVLFVFRSGTALLSILLVLFASVVVALAVCLLVFERVNLVTLAFGTSLLGVAVDYCFHYLCVQEKLGDGWSSAAKIRGGVVLSLLSSVLAYSLQFLSPFPGLHQFSVFVIAGLLVAGATVLFVLPLLTRQGSRAQLKSFSAVFDNKILPAYARLARYRASVAIALLVVVSVAVFALAEHGVRDDIRSLNTSSAVLMESEARVGKLLGRSGGQQYFLAQGGIQERLELTELLTARLAQKDSQGRFVGVHSLANYLPSQKRQRENYQLLRSKLFGPEGAQMVVCQRLASLCPQLTEFPAYKSGLSPETVPAAIAQALGLNDLRSELIDLVIPRQAVPQDLAEQVVSGLKSAHFIDRASEISSLLGELRTQLGLLIVGFTVILVVIAYSVFKASSIILAVPLLVSILLALAMAGVSGLSLFHMLAVLLVMGLTVDAAIFYLKLGLTAEVWLAATISAFTSMFAFGLLSFSSVPVLEQFGSVVSVGLLCAWLLIPLVYCMQKKTHQKG